MFSSLLCFRMYIQLYFIDLYVHIQCVVQGFSLVSLLFFFFFFFRFADFLPLATKINDLCATRCVSIVPWNLYIYFYFSAQYRGTHCDALNESLIRYFMIFMNIRVDLFEKYEIGRRRTQCERVKERKIYGFILVYIPFAKHVKFCSESELIKWHTHRERKSGRDSDSWLLVSFNIVIEVTVFMCIRSFWLSAVWFMVNTFYGSKSTGFFFLHFFLFCISFIAPKFAFSLSIFPFRFYFIQPWQSQSIPLCSINFTFLCKHTISCDIHSNIRMPTNYSL